MNQRPVPAIAMALILLAAAACGTAAPSPTPSPAPTLAVSSYEESAAAFCAAFGSLVRAVGNPDAGTPSVLSKALDDAVAAGDAAAAERLAASITGELEAGRQQAAAAARWQPAAPTMAAMDRVLVGFEAMIAAKRAAAAHTPGAVDPQTAFDQAGGVGAWADLVRAAGAMTLPAGVSPQPCPATQGTP